MPHVQQMPMVYLYQKHARRSFNVPGFACEASSTPWAARCGTFVQMLEQGRRNRVRYAFEYRVRPNAHRADRQAREMGLFGMASSLASEDAAAALATFEARRSSTASK